MRDLKHRLDHWLGRHLPERRLFLRSDTSTSYVRLRPLTQAALIGGGSAFVIWTLVATTILLVQSVGQGDLRAASLREQSYFEERLVDLTGQRDRANLEAREAHARFGQAMDRVALMQGQLLHSSQHGAELERGIEALQASLRTVTAERDAVVQRLAAIEGDQLADRLQLAEARLAEIEGAFDFVVAALRQTAMERETTAAQADAAGRQATELETQYRLVRDRNQRIFTQLEAAIEESMVPLERMFRDVGLQPDDVLRAVRSGYQAQSAALQPIAISTMGGSGTATDESRANRAIAALAQMDALRVAQARVPFAMPVRGGVTMTSGFGTRRDPRGGGRRMHNGVDWAGPRGTPIYTTASGTVTFAGRQSGFGNLVIVQHAFGIETYYAHLHSIGVDVGQRVSRGDRIGGMGTTGRSTGVHLHYEIRVNDRPTNPMNFIRAG